MEEVFRKRVILKGSPIRKKKDKEKGKEIKGPYK